MKIGVNVGDVMTRNFLSIKQDSNLFSCAEIMKKKRINSLVVLNKEKVIGILTAGDIIKAVVEKRDLSKISVKRAMSRGLTTISPEKDIYEALVLMKKKDIRLLPISSKGKIIGIITIKDVLKIEPSLFDIVSQGSILKNTFEKITGLQIGKRKETERKKLASGSTWIKEGDCQECSSYGILYNIDGRLLCEECKDTLE